MMSSFSAGSTEQVAVEEAPAGGQQFKGGARAAAAAGARSGDVLVAAQDLDVRVTPNDAGRRTRRIQQDALKGAARPRRAAAGECRRRRPSPAGRSGGDFPQSAHCAQHRYPAPRARPKSAVCSRMCTVLPPGAAQASRTRMHGRASSSHAASCAPASCTDIKPSAKPGRAATATGCSSSIAAGAHGRARAAIPCCASLARQSDTLERERSTRSTSGGGTLPARGSWQHPRAKPEGARQRTTPGGRSLPQARYRCARAARSARQRSAEARRSPGPRRRRARAGELPRPPDAPSPPERCASIRSDGRWRRGGR